MEVWCDIKGFEGIYQISSFGRVKSFKCSKKGYILSNRNKTGWYLNIVLRKDSLFRSIKIHRLVAETFLVNPENKAEVNHKDGNRQNNHVDNLEWVTRLENATDALKRSPQMIMGMNHYNRYIRPKTIEQFTLDGRFIAEYPNAKESQKAMGICPRNILQVATGDEYKPGKKRKQAGGYIWKFKKDIGGTQHEVHQLLFKF